MNFIGISAKKCEKLTFYLLNDLKVNFNKFSYTYFVKYWNFQGTCKKLPQTCDINWIHQELMELLTFLIFWSKLPLIWPYMECKSCTRVLQIHVLEIVKKHSFKITSWKNMWKTKWLTNLHICENFPHNKPWHNLYIRKIYNILINMVKKSIESIKIWWSY